MINDRIKAHRSAPDVYDAPTFDQMADRIEELEAKLANAVACIEDWQSSGCPDCSGDCSAANPPSSACIMQMTRTILAELKGDRG